LLFIDRFRLCYWVDRLTSGTDQPAVVTAGRSK
jgi:hypothetical protein